MEDSTLRPTPSYNANIPVVTSEGGTNIAYKDPNSPESILKKTTELNAQVAVDTKFDVATSPYYEGFQRFQGNCPYGCPYACPYGCPRRCRCPYCYQKETFQTTNPIDLQTLLLMTILVFVAAVSLPSLRAAGKVFLLSLCVILVVLTLTMYHH